jgi:CO/xanthine dehydrogenase FAD-binding subunit
MRAMRPWRLQAANSILRKKWLNPVAFAKLQEQRIPFAQFIEKTQGTSSVRIVVVNENSAAQSYGLEDLIAPRLP